MKRQSQVTPSLDDLMCHQHRLPILGICIEKECSVERACRYLCASCQLVHRYDAKAYIDEILNWDYISKHKFKRITDILEERKSRRNHKLNELEKNITKSFDNLKISINTLIEHKRSELLIALKEEANRGFSKETILLNKVIKLRESYEKQIKEFNIQNFLQEDLDPYLEKYNDIKLLEAKFHELQKEPPMTLPHLFETCSRIQQELTHEIPRCIERFEKRGAFKKLEKIISSFPKFTLSKDHIKISFLECKKENTSPQEDFDEHAIELENGEAQMEDGQDELELIFERLVLLRYDKANDFLYTQSASKRFIVLKGLKSKALCFSYPIHNAINCTALLEEAQKFYFATENGEVFGFDNLSKSLQKVYEFGIRISAITTVVQNPTWLVIAVRNSLLFLDSAKDPLLFKSYELHSEISTISHHSAHNLLILGFTDGKISLWNLDRNCEVSSKPSRTNCVKQIIQNPNGKSFFTIDENDFLCLWGIRQGSLNLTKRLKCSSRPLKLEILPLYSHNLLIIKQDWILKVYNLNTLKFVKKLTVRASDEFNMLYDENNAILNIFKIEVDRE